MNKKNTNKIKTKDLISIAIFSLLFAVCLFVAGGVLGILPVTFIFYAGPAGILFGIIYMYLRVKVPKRGAIMIQGILTAGIYALIGNPIIVPIIIMVFVILAEIATSIGHYKNFWWNTVGYTLFSFGVWGGKMAPMFISAKEYKEYAIRTGMGAEYTDQLLSYLNPTILILAIAATIVGCVIGAIIAKGLLRKHFEKIGIV